MYAINTTQHTWRFNPTRLTYLTFTFVIECQPQVVHSAPYDWKIQNKFCFKMNSCLFLYNLLLWLLLFNFRQLMQLLLLNAKLKSKPHTSSITYFHFPTIKRLATANSFTSNSWFKWMPIVPSAKSLIVHQMNHQLHHSTCAYTCLTSPSQQKHMTGICNLCWVTNKLSNPPLRTHTPSLSHRAGVCYLKLLADSTSGLSTHRVIQ